MQMCARIFTSAILTAAGLALSPAAEANDRFWSGIAPSFNRPAEPLAARSAAGSSSGRHYGPSDARARRARLVKRHATPEKTTPGATSADGGGREYDAISRVWFDGDGACWRGAEVFSVRHGTWFYGDARWQQVDGRWVTQAAPAPRRVDCGRETVSPNPASADAL
jgi:hypothetical protein